MYSRYITRVTMQAFEMINEGRYDEFAASCRPDVHHRFGGNHALGGERHDREHLRMWLDRLGRILPTLRLTPHNVWVKGWPWNTTVIARWTSTCMYPDGVTRYDNHGVHIIRIRWGKAYEIDANEDSQAVEDLLRAVAANGLEEAAAAPIIS